MRRRRGGIPFGVPGGRRGAEPVEQGEALLDDVTEAGDLLVGFDCGVRQVPGPLLGNTGPGLRERTVGAAALVGWAAGRAAVAGQRGGRADERCGALPGAQWSSTG